MIQKPQLHWVQNWYESRLLYWLGFLSVAEMIWDKINKFFFKNSVKRTQRKKSSMYRDHHLERHTISNSTICANSSVINSKSFWCSLNKENIFQGHHVLGEITHPVTTGCCSGNLCANISGDSQPQDRAEINPEITLIPFTQKEINTA